MLWQENRERVINTYREKWLEEHPKEIGEYSWDYFFTGGKQIRPTIFCELWNYLSPDSKINYELAFAIECIHVSSIVLDDTPWMDNADIRRGKKTIHSVFSAKKAVLIAYDLIDLAVEIWNKNIPNGISKDLWQLHLKSKLQRLLMGQWYDLDKKGNLIELASLKTGVLFELVTETVAICIGFDREFWKLWGNNLGILFQWMDDFEDMDEDIQQGNRNAFNESYELTYYNYKYLWSSIESGIGIQWFDLEIGQYMKKYFLEKINLNSDIRIPDNLSESMSFYPENIKIPELSDNSENQTQFRFYNGKHMLQIIWKKIESVDIPPKHNLWNMEESRWEIPI